MGLQEQNITGDQSKGITAGRQNKVVTGDLIARGNKSMTGVPETGHTEPFVVKVTGGACPIFEKQRLCQKQD